MLKFLLLGGKPLFLTFKADFVPVLAIHNSYDLTNIVLLRPANLLESGLQVFFVQETVPISIQTVEYVVKLQSRELSEECSAYEVFEVLKSHL